MQLQHQIVHHATHGYIHNGDIRELSVNGQIFRFRIDVHDDQDMGAPWENADGHGPVSDWTTRDKRPGEWVLSSDRGSKRYYDAQEANRIAERDGWGLSEVKQKALVERLARPRIVRRPTGPTSVRHRFGGLMQEYRPVSYETITVPGRDPAKPLTAGEIRAEAVRQDFEFLRGWANDQWHYVGVIVTLLDADDEDGRFTPIDYSHALWGIESEADKYLEEVAHELMGEAARESYREQQEASYWSARGVTTH